LTMDIREQKFRPTGGTGGQVRLPELPAAPAAGGSWENYLRLLESWWRDVRQAVNRGFEDVDRRIPAVVTPAAPDWAGQVSRLDTRILSLEKQIVTTAPTGPSAPGGQGNFVVPFRVVSPTGLVMFEVEVSGDAVFGGGTGTRVLRMQRAWLEMWSAYGLRWGDNHRLTVNGGVFRFNLGGADRLLVSGSGITANGGLIVNGGITGNSFLDLTTSPGTGYDDRLIRFPEGHGWSMDGDGNLIQYVNSLSGGWRVMLRGLDEEDAVVFDKVLELTTDGVWDVAKLALDGTEVDRTAVEINALVTNGNNLGETADAQGVFAGKDGLTLDFKSLVAGTRMDLAADDDEITISTSAEINFGGNIGTGEGVYAGKQDQELQFKSLVGGTRIGLASDGDGITISTSAQNNTGDNLGAGEGIFAGKDGQELQFKSLVAGDNITITSTANTITINADGGGGGGDGEANDGTNLGTGEGVYAGKSGETLQFRTIEGGTNVTVSLSGDNIVIDADGGGGGGGASTFLELTDTPNNYTDAAKKLVAVNAAGDELVFVDDVLVDIANVSGGEGGAGGTGSKPFLVLTDTGVQAEWVHAIEAVYTKNITVIGTSTSNLGLLWYENCIATYFNTSAEGPVTAIQFLREDAVNSPVGAITTTPTATNYLTESDARVKQDVVDLTDASARLKQLKPHRFAFKIKPGKKLDGFLADEVRDIVPEAVAVMDEKTGFLGIDHSKLVPLLTAALQEAFDRIASLEQQLKPKQEK